MSINDLENDLENIDLLVSLKNKEREIKLLEERKLMEQSSMSLVEDLFNSNDNIKSMEFTNQSKLIKSKFKKKQNYLNGDTKDSEKHNYIHNDKKY